MTKEELGITDAGEAYIDSLIELGAYERRVRRGEEPLGQLGYYERRISIARARVRLEGGVADAQDIELARQAE